MSSFQEDLLNTSADIFANSSAETVTENFPPPPVLDEITSHSLAASQSTPLINEIITETNNLHRICCPFCIFDYSFEFTLKEHIKESHPLELKIIFNAKPSELDFYQCPFCDSKFFYKELVTKHVMRKHELCVVNMFSGFSPDKYVYCRFCPHKTIRKHYKLLIIHIEKKHFQTFEKYVFDKYLIRKCDDFMSFDQTEAALYTSPGLSNEFLKLTTDDPELTQSPSVKSILKPRTAYPIEVGERVDDIMLKTEVSVLYANLEVKPDNKRVRRKLRFDLPETEFDEELKENLVSPVKRKKGNGKIKKIKKFLQAKKLQEPHVSPEEKLLSHYKCGICGEVFQRNSKLLDHVKRTHKGIRLQAQYCCGDCDAKFFKNSFLIKHSKLHHSPLCLKSSFVADQHNKF